MVVFYSDYYAKKETRFAFYHSLAAVPFDKWFESLFDKDINSRAESMIRITEIWDAEKKYNPEFIGFKWDDKNPRIQLEPRGERGYIELVPVKKI